MRVAIIVFLSTACLGCAHPIPRHDSDLTNDQSSYIAHDAATQLDRLYRTYHPNPQLVIAGDVQFGTHLVDAARSFGLAAVRTNDSIGGKTFDQFRIRYKINRFSQPELIVLTLELPSGTMSRGYSIRQGELSVGSDWTYRE